MSYGKYSPYLSNSTDFSFNAYGKVPVEFPTDPCLFDEKIHADGYDVAGFDSYGYSAFYEDGRYAGIGGGVDREGYTESEHLESYLRDLYDEDTAYDEYRSEH